MVLDGAGWCWMMVVDDDTGWCWMMVARLLFTKVLPGFTRFFFFYSQWRGKSQFTVWVKGNFGYRIKPFVRTCTGLYIGIKRLQSSLFYCSSMMPEPMNPLPPRTTMFYCTKATYM
jgi:hypothetical protein